MPTGATREWSWLIPAEAPGRLDRFEFVEVELVDGLQGLGGGAVVKAVGQGLEPGPVFGLQSDEFGDGIAPALGPAAAVGGSPVMDDRPGRGAGGAMPGLSLGIGHWFVAEGASGHGSTPKRYVTECSGVLIERTGERDRASATQAVAREIDAVGVVDETVEDRVGIGRVADDSVPFVDRDLAGEDGRAAAVAFLEDLVEVVASAGVKRFETPIVESR